MHLVSPHTPARLAGTRDDEVSPIAGSVGTRTCAVRKRPQLPERTVSSKHCELKITPAM